MVGLLVLLGLGISQPVVGDNPVAIRNGLNVSIQCLERGGGGILDFVPEPNDPTLIFKGPLVGKKPLLEKGYVVAGYKRKTRYEVIVKGLSYGEAATVRFLIPFDWKISRIDMYVKTASAKERLVECVQAPPPMPKRPVQAPAP